MAYSIQWTRRASSDIDHIYRFYLEKAGARIASSRLLKIKRDIAHLKSMPNIGPLDSDYPHTPTFRYLTVLSYKVYYFVEEQDVFIAAIWDCRQGGKDFEGNS